MNFFTKIFEAKKYKLVRKAINDLFKTNKISESEMEKHLQRISEIKRFPKKEYRDEELKKISGAIKNITNQTQQENKKEELVVMHKEVAAKKITPSVIQKKSKPFFREKTNYEKIQEWIAQRPKEISEELVSTADVYKEIGDPRFLNSVSPENYSSEADYLIEKSNNENYIDIAKYFTQNKNDSTRTMLALEKNLEYSQQETALTIIQEIYEYTPERAQDILVNVYLSKGDYNSAKRLMPTGKLSETYLDKCGKILLQKKEYKTALTCYSEVGKAILIKKCIQKMMTDHSLIEVRNMIKNISNTQELFEEILQEKIRLEETGTSKIFLEILDLFKVKNTYTATADFLTKKLVSLHFFRKSIEIINTYNIESTEIVKNISTEMLQEFNREKVRLCTNETILVCTFLAKNNAEKTVYSLQENIIQNYKRIGDQDGYRKFNDLIWDISQREIKNNTTKAEAA